MLSRHTAPHNEDQICKITEALSYLRGYINVFRSGKCIFLFYFIFFLGFFWVVVVVVFVLFCSSLFFFMFSFLSFLSSHYCYCYLPGYNV